MTFFYSVCAIFLGLVLRWLLLPSVIDFQSAVPTKVFGRRVIVTGASYGIGKHLAIELGRLGAKEIVIASRTASKLNLVKKEIEEKYNSTVHVIAVDLSNAKDCDQFIRDSVLKMGGLDILLLNHITNSRFGTWLVDNKNSAEGHSFIEEMFNVNAFSYIWLATAAMDELTKSGGAIGVVSSVAGHVGTPKTAIYSSTKHALHGFFDALRIELPMVGIHNVSITLCAIGATDTEGAAAVKAQVSAVTWDPPQPAAKAIVEGVVMRKREIFHPHYLVKPLLVLNSIAPGLVDYLLRTNMA